MLVQLQSVAPRFVLFLFRYFMQIKLHNGQPVELKHLQWFVIGACWKHLTDTDQLHLRDNPAEFRAFHTSVFGKLIAHLRDNRSLNASYSDFECDLAIEALKVFGKPS